MELLPAEIFYSYIFEYLQEDSINLALVNKQIYDYYVLKRDRNKFVKERFERVNSKRKECMEQNRPGVVFDRMYILYPYHESHALMLFVTTFGKVGAHGLVFLHFTTDEWQTVRRKPMHGSDSFRSNGMVETKWYVPISSWSRNLDNVWFAIELQLGDQLIFDNNSGWNYTSSTKYNHVPSLSSIYKCVFIPRNGELDIDDDEIDNYLSLNMWLHYEWYSQRSVWF